MKKSLDPLLSPIPLTQLIEKGFYAKKQLFSKFKLLSWSHSKRFRIARSLVSSFAGALFLDYGCGDGTFIALNHDLFPKATGFDRDHKTILDLKSRFAHTPGLHFSDVLPPLRPSFQLISCMEVLEHCVESVQVQIMEELSQLLLPDGHLLISVPIETGFPLFVKQIGRHFAGLIGMTDYRFMETYSFGEFIKAIFATKSSTLYRPIYPGGHTGHKGFNWRALETQIKQRFNVIQIKYSPIPFLGPIGGSQIFWLCTKKTER